MVIIHPKPKLIHYANTLIHVFVPLITNDFLLIIKVGKVFDREIILKFKKYLIFYEFGFFAVFFCVVPLLYLHNILITTNFDILKYIKKIFKISTQYIFNVQQITAPQKSIENLNLFLTLIFYIYFLKSFFTFLPVSLLLSFFSLKLFS